MCIKLDPKEPIAFYESARINQRLGNIDLAAEQSKRATELNSQNAWYLRLYAEILFARQDFHQAANEYKKLIKSNPGYPENYFLLATTYIYGGKYLKAIQTYNDIEEHLGVDKRVSIQKHALYM